MSQSFFRPALLVLALAAAGVGPVAAQSAPAASKPVTTDAKGGLAHLVAYGDITALDVGQRLVTIKGPKGNEGTFAVDPAVKNLDQVKVGDRIRLDYVVGVALALRKGGDGIREKVETESAAVAQPGTKPGVAAARKTTVIANVVAVNTKKKYATLKGPEGRTLDVAVQDPAILKSLKVGDQVAAVVTESVALNVQPAPAKK
ncbi:MAG TPA: hypothetical protein VFL64_03515 [Rhizobacter sp.]|nr:hypothetical protein [Rhizobacter sp.]